MLFFTGDEHYWHRNVIKYANRPYPSIEDMNEDIISKHNSVVKKGDRVIHDGDFALCSREKAQEIIKRLNGEHIFLIGSHDRWLGKRKQWDIRSYTIGNNQVIVCHYCLRTWPRSHYNSWHLYAHSHGRLEPIGKSHDIGVDNNGFYPVSEEEIEAIMKSRPDNPNLVNRQK
jgi:calcineurin-like phosphoesterase family protein